MSEPPTPPQQPSYDELVAENAQLRASLVQALADIADLKARLGMTSKNSSKPPSSDGLAQLAPKSLRGKSKRGPGRPKGQLGFTLSLVDDPDHEDPYGWISPGAFSLSPLLRLIDRECRECGGSAFDRGR